MLNTRHLALGVLFVSGTVLAQPAAPPAQPPAPPAQSPAAGQPAGGQAPGAVDLRVQQRPTLTTAEMVTNATEYRTRMNAVVVRIQALIEDARKSKDIIRINCLTDKLVQGKANQNIADRSFSTMQDAAARADEGASFHEYTRI